jgi:RNA polymerase sigma-70 factor (ECF subfamily)
MVKDHASVVPAGLLDEHGDALWRYAASRVPLDCIEDVIQDTLVAAVRSWPSFDRRSEVRTWLIGILSKKVADLYRRRAREAAPPGNERNGNAEDDFTPEGRWRETPASWSEISDTVVIEALRSCRDRLPLLLRDALELRDLRQLPPDVVCQELGITSTNLWTRLHRARLALRRCLEETFKNAPREERP